MLFYKHKQHIVPDNCTKYEQNHHILLWDITTNTQNVWKNSHNYWNLQQNQILFSMHHLPMLPDPWYPIWRKSSQPSWRNMQGWTDWCTDGWLDRPTNWALSYIAWICLGGAGKINMYINKLIKFVRQKEEIIKWWGVGLDHTPNRKVSQTKQEKFGQIWRLNFLNTMLLSYPLGHRSCVVMLLMHVISSDFNSIRTSETSIVISLTIPIIVIIQLCFLLYLEVSNW